MIDALTIKQWLLIYFIAQAFMWVILLCHVLGMKATLARLFNESELVRFLKEWKSTTPKG